MKKKLLTRSFKVIEKIRKHVNKYGEENVSSYYIRATALGYCPYMFADGFCLSFATALRRKLPKWQISAIVTNRGGENRIVHAFVHNPKDNVCIDYDGVTTLSEIRKEYAMVYNPYLSDKIMNKATMNILFPIHTTKTQRDLVRYEARLAKRHIRNNKSVYLNTNLK